jgi:N-terminal half of MaoC dehydratase
VALTEYIGTELGSQVVHIEAGPVKVFAQALLDDDPIYTSEHAPVPPTFPFVMSYWSTSGQAVGGGIDMNVLRKRGLILHGEQEFEYYDWPRVGDVLEGHGVVEDVYEKEGSSGVMEFYVSSTNWKNQATGAPVCKTKFILIVRRKKD